METKLGGFNYEIDAQSRRNNPHLSPIRALPILSSVKTSTEISMMKPGDGGAYL